MRDLIIFPLRNVSISFCRGGVALSLLPAMNLIFGFSDFQRLRVTLFFNKINMFQFERSKTLCHGYTFFFPDI